MANTMIYDLNNCPINERNGIYGGKAGDKEGITINDEYWIVKYPKNTLGMRGEVDSYTTAPLSEYIGSNIYKILGVDVHETILGIRNNKLVVACKDFCKREGSLREIRTLKNVFNKELSEIIESEFNSTSDSHLVDIDTLMLHFRLNPVLNKVEGITERFWTQFIVDILINNNDRNNGNWGVLYENGEYKLAPIFDNGASFANKKPDESLRKLLDSPDKLKQSILTSRTIYSHKRKELFVRDIQGLDYPEFKKVATKLVPIIEERLPDINSFILNIPDKYEGFYVCSDIRKEYYIKTMQLKLEWFLKPLLEDTKEIFEENTPIATLPKRGLKH